MIKGFISIVLLFSYSFGFSQQNVISSGGDANGSSGTFSFTIGQIDYLQTANTNQGVQQPIEFLFLSNDLRVTPDEINTFPNPTCNKLFVEILTESGDGLEIQLMDINGKILHKTTPNGKISSLNLGELASGIYFVIISRNSDIIERTKIIKL